MSKKIEIVELHNAALTTAAGATASTNAVCINQKEPIGNFSLIVTTAGVNSVLKVEPLVSFDGTNYYVARDKDGAAVSDIVTAHAVGTQVYAVSPVLAPWFKIRLTVTVANASNVTAKLAIQ